MVSRDLGEDISFLLYFVPSVISIAYGIYEWYSVGRGSGTMPGTAYLIVSKSPYLYLISMVAVCAALVIDVASTPVNEREPVLGINAARMQILSVIVIIVSLAAAISVGGYNLSTGFSDFIEGRYALIFSFSLVAISILLVPKQILGSARPSAYGEVLGLLLIVAAPIVLYLALKASINFDVSAILAIVVGLIGLYVYTNSSKLFRKKPETAPAPQSPTPKPNPTPAVTK